MAFPNLFRHTAGIILLLVIPFASADSLEEKVTAYRDCTEYTMLILDDRVSDAETIAIGAHAQCIVQFEAIYQERPAIGRDEWLKILKPHVVASVLKYRVMARQKPTPTKNKPSS